MIGPKVSRFTKTAIAIAALGLGGAAPGIAADFDIDAHWDMYEKAVVASDAEAWLELWDKDGIQMRPGMPARSYETLVSVIPEDWAKGPPVTEMNIDSIDFEIAGDWAFSRGEYNFTLQPEGEAVTLEGKFLTILKRQPDGSFKIYRDCFNMNSN